MKTEEITAAIFYLVPNAEFSFTETDLETLQWHMDDVEKPSAESIIAAIPLAKAKATADQKALESQKESVLDRLGITADEAKLLLG